MIELPSAQGREASDSEIEIGLARLGEHAACPEIERRAGTRFSPEDLPAAMASAVIDPMEYAEDETDGMLIVARHRERGVVGFACLSLIGEAEEAHLEEVDVDLDFGRRGIGRRLVLAACGWAAGHGSGTLSLTTFREVPWNAPFYAQLGFEVVPEEAWSEAIRALWAEEAEGGLDAARRCVMRRKIEDEDRVYLPR